MKNIKTKLTGAIILFLIILIVPLVVLATDEKIQIVSSEDEGQKEFIIYVKDMAQTDFKYAISNDSNSNELSLKFINSVEDEDGNKVAYIDANKYETLKNATVYLWVKDGETEILKAEPLNLSNAFEKSKMQTVENITKQIKVNTKVAISKEETINDVKITTITGAIEITDEQEATYYYQSVKLPAEKYSTLMELAEKMQTQYNEMDMYTKIETAKEFYNLYGELVKQVKWTQVENNVIPQPENTIEGDKYVVFIKKVKGENTTIDVQFLTSVREDKEEKIPEKTEIKTIQETTKLPITGDNIILFVILAVTIIALVLIFIKMKKLDKHTGKH